MYDNYGDFLVVMSAGKYVYDGNAYDTLSKAIFVRDKDELKFRLDNKVEY